MPSDAASLARGETARRGLNTAASVSTPTASAAISAPAMAAAVGSEKPKKPVLRAQKT